MGWLEQSLVTTAKSRMVVCRPAGCNRATPCLAPVAEASRGIRDISYAAFCAGVDRDAVTRAVSHFRMRPSKVGKPAHVCLFGSAEQWRKDGGHELESLQRDSVVLRISGPVADGFFVRCVAVLVHAQWAWRLGLRVTVSYRSDKDAYLDPNDHARDG